MLSRTAHRLPVFFLFAGAMLAAALFAASCDDGGSEGGNADVIAAINMMDNAGLHDIDESINNDNEIPPTALNTARQLQAVTALTEWPEDLQSQADALERLFEEFAAVLAADTPDMARAAEASKKVHDAEHDFSHDVWAHLYEEAGVETGGAGGH